MTIFTNGYNEINEPRRFSIFQDAFIHGAPITIRSSRSFAQMFEMPTIAPFDAISLMPHRYDTALHTLVYLICAQYLSAYFRYR